MVINNSDKRFHELLLTYQRPMLKYNLIVLCCVFIGNILSFTLGQLQLEEGAPEAKVSQ